MTNELYQQAREKLAKVYYSKGYSLMDWDTSPHREAYLAIADQILALIKEAGYVRLADDQTLPEIGCENGLGICGGDGECNANCWLKIPRAKYVAQQDMLNNNWRRVVINKPSVI
jgi:hypothetical protein